MRTTILILSLLAVSASAFQTMLLKPSMATTTSTPLKASNLDGTFGTGPETGDKCPPLGAYIFDNINERGIKRFKTCEIKHGRVAMVATIGYMIQKRGIHFPLYLGPSGSNPFNPESDQDWFLSESAGVTFTDIAHAPSPIEALGMVPLFGWYQVLFVAGWFELLKAGTQQSEIPGDFGFDPLGFTKREGGLESPELKNLRLKEIKNGRLAM